MGDTRWRGRWGKIIYSKVRVRLGREALSQLILNENDFPGERKTREGLCNDRQENEAKGPFLRLTLTSFAKEKTLARPQNKRN